MCYFSIINTINADVGGDLAIESIQDNIKSVDKDSGMNIRVQVSFGTAWGASGGGNFSHANGTYAGVNEQSGLYAGDGGYHITVGGNTDLKGGAIISTQQAEDEEKNSFTTATLTTSDIENYAYAEAESGGISLSTGDASGKYNMAKAIGRNLLDNAEESKYKTSTTFSSISTDNILITDNEAQFALTGKDALQTIEEINHDIENIANTITPIDLDSLVEDVETQRKFNQAAFEVATYFTDESFRTMFLQEHPMVEILTDENGEILLDKDGKPLTRALSDEEKLQLKKGSNGKINIAINGIFNDEDAAVAYAIQHANSDGPLYAIVFPEANFVSELLIAGYQKFLENDFWGLANSTQELRDTMAYYGNDGLDIDAHSRGAMTTGNAMESLIYNGYYSSLTNTSINFFGPAYNAEAAANLLNILSNGAQTSVNLQVHVDDFVGTIIGGNPSTGGVTPEGSSKLESWIDMFIKSETAHSCYGNGREGCNIYWGNDWEDYDSKTMVINANNGGEE